MFSLIRGRQLAEKNYWRPQIRQGVVSGERIRELVKESVRLRLRSDVPVGVFLSGGIDSNVVAYEAAIESEGEVETFTVGMPDESLDESVVAQAAAQKFGSGTKFCLWRFLQNGI